jgi:hypothetical protein
MDRKTYKAARRAIIFAGIKEIVDGLYGLRLRVAEDEYFNELCENVIDVELEDET